MEKKIKKGSWWKKSLSILVVLIFLFLIFVGYGVGVNNRFYKLLVVTSGSMSPVFNAGDLIFITRMNSSEAKVGDIVTFLTRDGLLLTHRIVEIKNDGEIVTKGDANNTNDNWTDGWKLGEVGTKYIFKIPKLGYFISWWKGIFNSTGALLNDKMVTNNQIVADISKPTQ